MSTLVEMSPAFVGCSENVHRLMAPSGCSAGVDELAWISRYIYADKELLDAFICEALSVAELKKGDGGLSESSSTADFESSDCDSDQAVPIRRSGKPAPPTVRKAMAPGECFRCKVHETPQWRYVHHLRFCNACYMRIKRYTEQMHPGIKLPPRAKQLKEIDENMAKIAVDLASAAFL